MLPDAVISKSLILTEFFLILFTGIFLIRFIGNVPVCTSVKERTFLKKEYRNIFNCRYFNNYRRILNRRLRLFMNIYHFVTEGD